MKLKRRNSKQTIGQSRGLDASEAYRNLRKEVYHTMSIRYKRLRGVSPIMTTDYIRSCNEEVENMAMLSLSRNEGKIKNGDQNSRLHEGIILFF